jgi:hypothetical protein
MRVQRTRAARFARIGSPLTRHPLGALRCLLAAALALVLPIGLLAEEPLSPAQAEGLAAEALRHTPENLHWAKGTRFSWVLFVVPKDSTQVDLMNRIRTKLAKRYQVFDTAADIPPGLVDSDAGHTTYRDGFLFSVSVQIVDPKTVDVTYSDFENSLAASHQKIRYRWNGSRWRVRNKAPLTVS